MTLTFLVATLHSLQLRAHGQGPVSFSDRSHGNHDGLHHCGVVRCCDAWEKGCQRTRGQHIQEKQVAIQVNQPRSIETMYQSIQSILPQMNIKSIITRACTQTVFVVNVVYIYILNCMITHNIIFPIIY